MGQGQAFLAQLRAELELGTPLEATESQWAPRELAGTPVLSREHRELGGLGAMGQWGVRLLAGSVPGQCPAAMSPLGFSHVSWWKGPHRERNVSWCPRSSRGWRRKRRRQMQAEVSASQPPATEGCHMPPWGQWQAQPQLCTPVPELSVVAQTLLHRAPLPLLAWRPRSMGASPWGGRQRGVPVVHPCVPHPSLSHPSLGLQPALASTSRWCGWVPCGSCTPGCCGCPRRTWP